MKVRSLFILFFFFTATLFSQKPNVIIIYADDLGYGDLGCYGATKLKTPHLDKLASEGILFTRAYTTAATCTPSRYSLMTGRYPFRQSGTGVLPGDAKLIIDTAFFTLPKVFKQSGYTTAVIGKWHLGLGTSVEKNWNERITPGPNQVGFDYSYIFPATADRVPTIFLENGNAVGLKKDDIIKVNYQTKIGNEPTGKENPELLKMLSSPNHGHENTIVNGIGRIGYMTGGKEARWVDEEIGTSFLHKSMEFIDKNKTNPFFLFFALTEPHVPRMPTTEFKGKSGLGFRGDAILQLDWTVGKITEYIKLLGIEKNTMIIFTSDNGPVLDDGYVDGAVTQLNGHTPAGNLRGGKYSIFEAGTRVPFIVKWKQKIKKAAVSDALISQVDFLSSFCKLFKITPTDKFTDSENNMDALLGNSKGRSSLVVQAGTTAIITKDYKYVYPGNGPAMSILTNTELGNSPLPQLFNLQTDPGEKVNLAGKHPEKVASLEAELLKVRNKKMN